jgi:dTDP-4-amino-4,6-dideoxy-D-galactose acyltransferase
MRHLEVEAVPPPAPQLERFLSAWPFKPHRWGGTGPMDGLERLLLTRVQHGFDEAGAVTWSATNDGRLGGFATLRPLTWDSQVLAMRCGRLDAFLNGSYEEGRNAADALLEAAVGGARHNGLEHLSIRVDAGDDPIVHALESNGFLNVDALITFSAPIVDLAPPVSVGGVQLRRAAADDAAAIVELAGISFRDGRFHTDPSIPPQRARDVYRVWAAACCDGSAADTTIVAVDDSAVVGFVACRMLADTAVHLQRPTGTIPLIATSESVRGRGVGQALIGAAAQWFRSEEAAAVEVGTQLRNVAAARLYERCGFRLAAGSLSFRRMIEQ